MKIEQLVSFLEMELEQYCLNQMTEGLGLQDEYLRSDGSGREFLQATYGGSSYPLQKKP